MEALRRYPVVSDETVPDDPMWDPGNHVMLGRAGLDAIRLAMLCAQKTLRRPAGYWASDVAGER